jgi:hypothetical protein
LKITKKTKIEDGEDYLRLRMQGVRSRMMKIEDAILKLSQDVEREREL